MIIFQGWRMAYPNDIMNVSRVFVTKYLQSLKEKGFIIRIGSDRKGYWKINQTN